jgi:hypothetical protein
MFFPGFLKPKSLFGNLQRASSGITNFISAHPYAFTALFCISLLALAKAEGIAEPGEAEEAELTCFNWLNMATSTCFQRYSDVTWRCLNTAAKYFGLSPEQMRECASKAGQYQEYKHISAYNIHNCFYRENEYRVLREEDGYFQYSYPSSP